MERANGDIKDMHVALMGDNDTNDLSVGIKFVQFQNNSSYHSGIQRSPSLYGCTVRMILSLPYPIYQSS